MSTFYNKQTKKWQASYRENGRVVYCGYFPDQQSALQAIERRKHPTPKEELALATSDFVRLTSELLHAKIRMERAERAMSNDSSGPPPNAAGARKPTHKPKWQHDLDTAKAAEVGMTLHNIEAVERGRQTGGQASQPVPDRVQVDLDRLNDDDWDSLTDEDLAEMATTAAITKGQP